MWTGPMSIDKDVVVYSNRDVFELFEEGTVASNLRDVLPHVLPHTLPHTLRHTLCHTSGRPGNGGLSSKEGGAWHDL